MEKRIEQQLAFSLEIDKVKNIFRQTHLSGNGRNENDAEHSWHMAIMAYLLREYANEEVDIAKVMLMCLIHDIVEIDENGGEYLGGYVPYEHPLKDKVFEYAKKACEYVPGLKGFIGIDFIIDGDYIYLLEINSRFTTSYVGLQKIININIAKTIIDLIDKKISVEDIGEIAYSSK